VYLLSRSSVRRDAWPLLVAVDAGNRIGFGHLKRCLAIATQAHLQGAKVDFEIGGDIASGRKLVETAGFRCSEKAIENTTILVVLADRLYGEVLQHPEGLEADIGRWRGQGARIAFIDGFGKDSLRHRRPHLPVDLFIAPYAGERCETSKFARLLVGPAFAPLGPEYENAALRQIEPEANRILVSCGGSDPFEITATSITALAQLHGRKLSVRVMLGPGFQSAYCDALIAMAQRSPHNIECLHSADSLAVHMRWADLAIATSGLTKYELAATGTPAVLISPDQKHAIANEPFAALGTAADLGWVERVTPSELASKVRSLLDDTQRRSAMARAGMRAVDGRGATRIAAALNELAFAES
jgi:UDP-2,4-diacetamido-2,4,6-trideoxy-beta-L-altropyranose hydrolase